MTDMAKSQPIASPDIPLSDKAKVDGSMETAIVRIAGDSGDGVQLVGGRFSINSALTGNDLVTFPDFPAEIRAPTGSIYGVSPIRCILVAAISKPLAIMLMCWWRLIPPR